AGLVPEGASTMTKAQVVKTVLALAHLLLVVCGATRWVPAPRESSLRRGLALYGDYSGAGNGYGFFAPSVASPWDVRFSVYSEAGSWVEGAMPEANREVRLRFGTVLGGLAQDELREPLAASLAARRFAAHPDAQLINAHVRALRLTTMAEHRAGVRPEWITMSVYSFANEPEM